MCCLQVCISGKKSFWRLYTKDLKTDTELSLLREISKEITGNMRFNNKDENHIVFGVVKKLKTH